MFFNLCYSEQKYYTPTDFCNAFKDYEGNPTKVNEQMDIDEFSGILFDRLESQMKGTNYENVVKDFFGGIFSNEIICPVLEMANLFNLFVFLMVSKVHLHVHESLVCLTVYLQIKLC